MNLLFLGTEQQVIQDCNIRDKGNKGSPGATLAFCTEACSGLWHKKNPGKTGQSCCTEGRVQGDYDSENFGTNYKRGGSYKEKGLQTSG